MKTYVIDIETDGLVDYSKIHVFSVGYKDKNGDWRVKSTSDYDVMRDIVSDPNNYIVGHYFKLFDARALEDLLEVEVKAFVIDTLALAWYIFPEIGKGSYGLEAFGERYGVPKPEIEDWEGLTYSEYKHRCEEDVKINIKLWEEIVSRLMEIYGSKDEVIRIIKYLMFKMDCIVDQHKLQVDIDNEKLKENLAMLKPLEAEKIEKLQEAMPPGKEIKSRPKNMYKVKVHKKPSKPYKADGSLSKTGEKWFKFLKEKGLPENTEEWEERSPSAHAEKWYEYLRENGLPMTTEVVYDDPNPGSTHQIKAWLEGLGWEPEIFKDGTNGPVPQVRNDDRELCDSVLALAEKEPAIEHLEGLSVIQHRIGVLESFQKAMNNGKVIADMQGFTNTLRLKHSKPIANLPGVTGSIRKALEKGQTKMEGLLSDLRDGEIVREIIVAPKGYELVGSDISSLEDNTKRHFMYDYDPEYVEEQMEEGFDPHLDLAVRGGALTEEQVQSHKDGTESHKAIRDQYKVANYSCIYGVGAPKLSKTTGTSVKEARKLIRAYWDRNWSVKALVKDVVTKTDSRGQMWLQNPINNFWYSVRSEKDIFSTLNQGSGAFVFDLWLKKIRKRGIIPILQYHDEFLAFNKKKDRERVKRILEESMEKVNKTLNLNVEIKVDVQFGETYADVH